MGLLFAGAGLLHAQELLRNGDFEAGRLPPWSITEVTGSKVSLQAENSPFASGNSSVLLNDDDSVFDEPSLRQSFEATPSVTFGFDFKMLPGEELIPWYVAWNGEGDTTGFFFSLGGADGTSIELNQQRIADLKRNVWYRIEGWADAPRQSVRGSLQEHGGVRTDFTGGFPFALNTALNAVEVSDGNDERTPSLVLDNFTTRPISLEIARNAAGETVITWPLPDFRLQSVATVAETNWTDVASSAGVYTNTFTDRMRFFRLAR